MNERLESDLERWTAAGLIEASQAAAILEAESHGSTDATPPAPAEKRDASFLIEGVAYVGGAIAIASVLAMVAIYYDDLAPVARVGIPALVTIALFIGGIGLVGPNPSFRRIGSLMWAVSVAMFALSAGLIVDAISDDAEDSSLAFCIIAATTAAYSAVLWLRRSQNLQQLTTYVATLVFIWSLLSLPEHSPDIVWFSLVFWTFGVVWLLLAWAEIIKPRDMALLLGSLTVVGAVLPYSIDQDAIGTTWQAITALALVGLGIASRKVVLFVVGAIGVAIAIIEISVMYLDSSLGALLGLFLAGAVLLGGTIVFVNLRKTDDAQ